MGKFLSTKTYGTDRGLSCTFRQAGATHSHCSLLHGYSIGIKLVFECDELDERNWVFDFGGLKEYRSSEGREVLVPYRGEVAVTVQNILGGVRSTCTYVGANTLKQLSKCTTFIRVNNQFNRTYESTTTKL